MPERPSVAAVLNATPLIALDAIVLDTETTGLDPRKARIVEMAAVRIIGGQVDAREPLRRLVDPGEPVPPEASRIHGINDLILKGAPGFRQVWPEFEQALSGTVVIGHTIGFDLAMLLNECRRSGYVWTAPRTLDTRLLAELVEPNLAGFALDQLAAWLNVPVEGRHSATADAVTTARIFLALLPKLRDRGIRTLAEAEQASRGLTAALDTQHRAGWAEPAAPPVQARRITATARIETYPYRHRIRDVMTLPAQFIDAHGRLPRHYSAWPASRYRRCLFVFEADSFDISAIDRHCDRARHHAGTCGAGRRGACAAGRNHCQPSARNRTGRSIRLSRNRPHEPAWHPASRCHRWRRDIIGALSARDLLRMRAGEAVSLDDEIDEAQDVPSLGSAWAKLPHVAAALLAEGLAGREIAAVISDELGALTARAAVIAERRMAERGQGPPPCPLRVCGVGLCRSRREPARDGPGQRPGVFRG